MQTKSIVVPTANLANLIYRAMYAGRLPYNYCVGARDSSGGIYIHLTVAEWVKSQPFVRVYVNPHTR